MAVGSQAWSLGPPKRVELTASSEQPEYCGRVRRWPSTQVPDIAKLKGTPGKHEHSRTLRTSMRSGTVKQPHDTGSDRDVWEL